MEFLSPEWSFSCSPVELYTLASLLGGEMLIGVPDPFPGWLTEEIQEAMEGAMGSLMASGVLAPRDNGQIVMDVAVAALVGTMIAPQTVFVLTTTIASPHQLFCRRNIYHRPPLTMMMELREEPWTLRFLPDPEAVLQQVRECWRLGSQEAVSASPFALPESVLEQARQVRPAGEQEVREQLEKAGVSAANAAALAHTLVHPIRNGALVAVRAHEGNWDTGGLGMLEGENGLWMLRSFSRQQTQWIECIPRSGEQLMADVETLVHRFLPPPET